MSKAERLIDKLIVGLFALIAILLVCKLAFGEAFYINNLGGGLNTKSSPLILKDNESSSCRNVYFDTSGAILKRKGQNVFTTTPSTGTLSAIDGLYQFSMDDGSEFLMGVSGGDLLKMDSADGTWDTIRTVTSQTTAYLCDWETYQDICIVTNGNDEPQEWDGSSITTTDLDAVSDLSLESADWVADFKDRLFLGNVTISSTAYPNRVYYSDNTDITTWGATSFLTVGYSDGEEITGLKVLGDELIVYKERSIWKIRYIGDPDLPFAVVKSLSDVGCISGRTVQEVTNHHVFLSSTGELCVFNGVNSEKISGRIDTTLQAYSKGRYDDAVSTNYRKLNQYWLSFTSTGSAHDRVIVWDYFNNAFTEYDGIEMNAVTTYLDSSFTEKLLTGDKTYGQIFRQDTSEQYNDDDYNNTETAIDAYWWSRWFDFQDLIHEKNTTDINPMFKKVGDWDMDLGYQFDFIDGVWRTEAISLSTGQDAAIVGTSFVGSGVIGSEGMGFYRVRTQSQGLAIRFKFSNDRLGEYFILFGFGINTELSDTVINQ